MPSSRSATSSSTPPGLGPAGLDFLPEPHTLAAEQVRPLVRLINEIGGAEAVPHARRWALAHPEFSHPLAGGWDSYPVETYARQVLSVLDLTHEGLQVDSRQKLAVLHHLPSVTNLVITGSFTSAELHAALRGLPWSGLSFWRNHGMTDLSFLADCADQLGFLSLYGCPAVQDLAPLTGLPALRTVELDMIHVPAATLTATASRKLRSLRLSRLAADRLTRLPAHPELRSLTIDKTVSLEVDSLDGWTRLCHLDLDARTPAGPLLAALRRAPQVAQVALTLDSLTEFGDEQPVPSVRELTLHPEADMLGLERVPRLFPALTWLTLTPPMHVRDVDLSPLQAMPGCRVTVTGEASIRGAEGLDVGR